MTVLPDISASVYTRRGGFPVWTTNFGRGLFSIFYKTTNTDQTALKVIFTILQYSLSLRYMRMHMYIYFTEESYTLQGQYSTFNIDTLYYKCSFFVQKMIDH